MKHANYERVLREVQGLFKEPQVAVEPIPQFVFRAVKSLVPFAAGRKRPVKYDYCRDDSRSTVSSGELTVGQDNVKDLLPEALKNALYKFQIEGVDFSLKHYGRVLIGDEMGVGKTVQALAASYIYREDWPMLIVAPASLKFVWRDEIRKWLPTIPPGRVEIVKSSKNAFATDSLVYIMSYDLAKNVHELLDKKSFRVAIADEAHYLKSKDAKRSKILSPILARCKRVILLSGTPMLSRPREIFNLVQILRPDIFTRFGEFGNRYCDPHPGPFGMDWTGCTHPEELHCILASTMMIRRLKSEVLSELPKKRRQKIVIEADKKAAKEIADLLAKVDKGFIQTTLAQARPESMEDDTLAASTKNRDRSSQQSNLFEAYMLTGMSKIKGVVNFVGTLLANEIKFIVFAQHLAVMDAIEEHVKKEKTRYIRIDGSVPLAKRHDLVQDFQENPDCMAAILSITASSQGITLTAAYTVVFAEFAWTPGLMDQAEDRAHRISQKYPVNVYYLYAEDTLDPIMYNVIRGKNEVVAQALDGKEVIYKLDAGTKEDAVEESKVKGADSARIRGGNTLFSYFQFKDKKKDQSAVTSTSKVIPIAEPSGEEDPFHVTLDEKEQTELMSMFEWLEAQDGKENEKEPLEEGKRISSQFRPAIEAAELEESHSKVEVKGPSANP